VINRNARLLPVRMDIIDVDQWERLGDTRTQRIIARLVFDTVRIATAPSATLYPFPLRE